jgi:hypothetical protein
MISVCFWSKNGLHVCSFQLCPVGILLLLLFPFGISILLGRELVEKSKTYSKKVKYLII